MKYLIILIFILESSCSAQVKIDNITDIPKVTDADKVLANVYKPLDGTWKGVFMVKQDSSPVEKPNSLQDKATILQFIEKAQTINTIGVTQVYTSDSPYFQRVSITDFYPDTGKTEQSKGVNKIQDGEMWCVVRKPSETVIHKGSALNSETIVWQSSKPNRIEYFYETVTKDYYEIIGYGYYINDDISQSPKLWFYGKYERQL